MPGTVAKIVLPVGYRRYQFHGKFDNYIGANHQSWSGFSDLSAQGWVEANEPEFTASWSSWPRVQRCHRPATILVLWFPQDLRSIEPSARPARRESCGAPQAVASEGQAVPRVPLVTRPVAYLLQ